MPSAVRPLSVVALLCLSLALAACAAAPSGGGRDALAGPPAGTVDQPGQAAVPVPAGEAEPARQDATFLGLGRAALDGQRFAEALGHLQHSLRLGGDVEARFLEGVALFNLNRFPEAAEDFAAVAAERPQFGFGFFSLGLASAMAGDMDAAAAGFSEALHLYPTVESALAWRSLVLWEQGAPDQAVRDLDAALDVCNRPLNPDPLFEDAAERYPLLRAQSRDLLAGLERRGAAGPLAAYAPALRCLAARGAGDSAAARVLADQALALAPGWSTAHLLSGLLYRDGSAPDLAEAAFTRAVELDAGNRLALLHRAEVRADQDRHAEAEADYLRAIELAPKSSVALYRLGSSRVAQGRYREAVADLNRCLELNPQNNSARLELGKALFFLKAAAQAEEQFNQVAARQPKSSAAYFWRGRARLEQGRFAEAEADQDAALALDPQFAWALFYRGFIRAKLGQGESAEADMAQAMRQAPGTAHFFDLRGWLRLNADRLAEARADFDASLAVRPGDPWTLRQRGHARRKSGDAAGAVEDYTASLAAQPDAAESLLYRGQAYLDASRPQEALADLDRAVQLLPGSAEAALTRGYALSQLKRHAEARDEYTRGLALNPKDFRGYMGRGLSRGSLGDIAGAVQDFDAALNLNPASLHALLARGAAHGDLRHYDLAAADFTAALRLRPDLAHVYTVRGGIYRLANRLDEAEADCRRALQLDTGEHEARCELGLVLLEQGRSREALDELRIAVDHAPQNGRLLNELAWALAVHPLPDPDLAAKAVPLAEAAVRLTGKAPHIVDTLAAALARVGRFAEAVATQQQALSLLPADSSPELRQRLQSRLDLYRQGKPYDEER